MPNTVKDRVQRALPGMQSMDVPQGSNNISTANVRKIYWYSVTLLEAVLKRKYTRMTAVAVASPSS